MAYGAFKFKDSSGNVVSYISGSGANMYFSGGTLDLSGMSSLNLGNVSFNATSASHAANYLLTSSFNSYTGTTNASVRLNTLESKTGSYATTGSNLFKGNQTISGSVIPAVSDTYDLGSETNQFRHLYLSSASLYIDGTKVLGSTSQELQITTDVGQSFKILEAGSDNITLQSADGNIELKSSGGGDVVIDPTNGIIGLKGTVTIYTGNKIVSSDGNSIQFGNGITVTGSILSTVTPLVSGSSQISFTGLSNTPSGIISGSAQLSGFGFATTGSNNFQGTQTITGSLYISQNLVVQGSSSLEDITGSNVYIGTNKINLNTDTPAIRFGGLSVFDSGSNFGESGSLLWDSQNNRWLYQHPASSGAPYKSAILISGPQNSGDLGSEGTLTSGKISKAVGDDHIGDSIITETNGGIGISGSLSITGSMIATGTNTFVGNQTISGSLKVTSVIETSADGLGSEGGQLILRGPVNRYNVDNWSGLGLRIFREDDSNGANGNVIIFASGSGQVGINKNGTNATLDVNGNALVSGSLTTTGNINVNSDGVAINRSTSGEPYLFFRKDGVNRGSIYGADNTSGLRFFVGDSNLTLTLTSGSATINGNLTTTGTINGLSLPNDLFAQQFLLMGS
jgi:hypothetical protein